jgi:hypothetical protein
MESFLAACKRSFLEGITPSNKLNQEREDYTRIVRIAKEYFQKDLYNDFAGFFIEGQYLIPLWAAHMLVEYGKPNKYLMGTALNVIKDYSDNPLAPIVAEEEKQWLIENEKKYKDLLL